MCLDYINHWPNLLSKTSNLSKKNSSVIAAHWYIMLLLGQNNQVIYNQNN